MQKLAALSHKRDASARRKESAATQRKALRSQEGQRGRLRDTSVLPNMRVHYDMKPHAKLRRKDASRATAQLPQPPIPPTRALALQERLSEPEPPKFSPLQWEAYKERSIHILQFYYPNTDLAELYEWVSVHSHEKGKPRLSSMILEQVRQMFPQTEVSSCEEMRNLLKSLAIRWCNLHSAYYASIAKRADVVEHRAQFLPIALMCFGDSRVYFVVSDSSFMHENAFSKEAWCAMPKPGGNTVDAKPGKGPRVNVMEFLDKDGLVRHPDGKSAGTHFGTNNTQDSQDFLRGLERGCQGIQAKALSRGCKVTVLLIDGARTQKTMPNDAIDPSMMNLSDEGKNRKPMRSIGTKGARRVLQENKMWPDEGLSLPEARRILLQWRRYTDQLTEAEELCRKYGIILLYNPKGHPWLNPIEKFWRYAKYQIQDLHDLRLINAEYEKLVDQFMSGSSDTKDRCKKWFDLAHKYVLYYARGKDTFVDEAMMKSLDLDQFGSLQVRPTRPTALRELGPSIHAANIILMLGKKYSQNFQSWGD